jgi:hypothetical protein
MKKLGNHKEKRTALASRRTVRKKGKKKKRPLEQISSPSPFAVLKVLSYVKTSIDREQG